MLVEATPCGRPSKAGTGPAPTLMRPSPTIAPGTIAV